MKLLLSLLLFYTLSFASLDSIVSLDSDFTQTVTDDKNNTLVYKGHVLAKKPQYALWKYTSPVQKEIYIALSKVTIIEPALEQVIIKNIESNFNFFNMIQNSKRVKEGLYIAIYKDVKYTIIQNATFIESISYTDELENRVKILFTNQEQNRKINETLFTPSLPSHYDIVVD